MEISEEELIKAIPSYLKTIEKDSIPYPAIICTMGVNVIDYQAQIKLTSIMNRNLSFTLDVPDDKKDVFLSIYRKIKEEK